MRKFVWPLAVSCVVLSGCDVFFALRFARRLTRSQTGVGSTEHTTTLPADDRAGHVNNGKGQAAHVVDKVEDDQSEAVDLEVPQAPQLATTASNTSEDRQLKPAAQHEHVLEDEEKQTTPAAAVWYFLDQFAEVYLEMENAFTGSFDVPGVERALRRVLVDRYRTARSIVLLAKERYASWKRITAGITAAYALDPDEEPVPEMSLKVLGVVVTSNDADGQWPGLTRTQLIQRYNTRPEADHGKDMWLEIEFEEKSLAHMVDVLLPKDAKVRTFEDLQRLLTFLGTVFDDVNMLGSKFHDRDTKDQHAWYMKFIKSVKIVCRVGVVTWQRGQ
ncbi:unnamed protein product [Amoebophrya sp. A25]|nr:unnamed protein product [Amoebophrya sp. A25]|eukprot:GSA25T00004443001.1